MAPYMQTVYEKVSAITSPSGKDLFQLNEAIFNVERDDDPSPQLAGKLFAWIQKLHRDFVGGKTGGSDENFFYDYLGLLGTMQNQHFFSAKQVQRIQGFMHEALGAELGKDTGGKAAPAKGADAAKLQAENDQLKKLLAAVKTIQTFSIGGAASAAAAEDGEPKKKKRNRGGKKGEAAEEAPAPAEEKEKKARKPRNRGKKGEGEAAEAPAKESPKKEGDGEAKPKRQRNRKGKKEGEGEKGGE